MDAIARYEQMKKKLAAGAYAIVAMTMLREGTAKDQDEAHTKMDAFFQWFSLIPEGKKLQMVETVDDAWHAFILNTALYEDFCMEYAGEYIHHDPNDVFGNSHELKQKYAEGTLARLRWVFGETMNSLLMGLNQRVTCCIGCGGGRIAATA